MRGVVSFHPVDPGFFEMIIEPLVAGEKINPEAYLEAACRMVVASWETERYKHTLAWLLEQLQPPPPPEHGTMWEKVRARLERFDHKPSPLVRLVGAKIDPDLHLHGRPFLITEGSAESVASITDEYAQAEGGPNVQSLVIEQLVRLDPGLAKELEPEQSFDPPAPASYRSTLLSELKAIYDIAQAARAGESWGPAGGTREPARNVLARELPWRAVHLHSRAVPFWIGQDVDGLETLCHAAGISAPDFIVPARRLFARSAELFPEIREEMSAELKGDHSVGAFVAPGDVSELLAFLAENGSKIIRAAAQHGVASECQTLLRKIRECARYAERHGVAYLEASGVLPEGPRPEDEE